LFALIAATYGQVVGVGIDHLRIVVIAFKQAFQVACRIELVAFTDELLGVHGIPQTPAPAAACRRLPIR